VTGTQNRIMKALVRAAMTRYGGETPNRDQVGGFVSGLLRTMDLPYASAEVEGIGAAAVGRFFQETEGAARA